MQQKCPNVTLMLFVRGHKYRYEFSNLQHYVSFYNLIICFNVTYQNLSEP